MWKSFFLLLIFQLKCWVLAVFPKDVACHDGANDVEEHDLEHQEKIKLGHCVDAVGHLRLEVCRLCEHQNNSVENCNRDHATSVAALLLQTHHAHALPDKVDNVKWKKGPARQFETCAFVWVVVEYVLWRAGHYSVDSDTNEIKPNPKLFVLFCESDVCWAEPFRKKSEWAISGPLAYEAICHDQYY